MNPRTQKSPKTETLSFLAEAPIRRSLVLSLFFFSGASGLIYEVVWSRMFKLVLGTTVYSVATVLGVFMGGLALGSWIFGRMADRDRANGMRMYGWLEIGIGLSAVLLPAFMGLADLIYRWAWPAISDSFFGQTFLRVTLTVFTLIIPATFMGGTLPVLSRFLVRRFERSGLEIGSLYAINTLGAVLGAFLAGFFLLELMGIRLSLTLAAILNFSVGFLALLWARGREAPGGTAGGPPEPDTKLDYTPRQLRQTLFLFALSGFAALALEVFWTRALMYFVSIDTWAFTAMLAAFLAGIGLGSLLMARFTDRIPDPLKALAGIEILIGLTAALSIPLFRLLHGIGGAEAWGMLGEATLLRNIGSKLTQSFFIMLLPTLLMGAAFPLVSRLYVIGQGCVGRGIGTLYALNTLGAILGSLAAGFLLIPLLGLEGGILFAASTYVIIGLLLFVVGARTPSSRSVRSGFAGIGLLLLLGGNAFFESRPMILRSRWFKADPGRYELVYSHEGPSSSLAVLQKANGVRELNLNGFSTAADNYMDMQVHRMLSHVPMLLHPRPEKALVVGFGMGSTVWGCCQHEVRRVDVVELLEAEKETAPFFESVNHGVLDHPKLRFIVGDGRNYLLATREKYDVISFNAIHPRYSANLYTVEFYRMCRDRMTENGVICAWMTQNSMTDPEWRMLCKSFVEVFPDSSLWYCNPQHFCLIGAKKPLRIDPEDWNRRIRRKGVKSDLEDSNLGDPWVLLSRFMFGGERLAAYLSGAALNTDDHPRIEFLRETKREEALVIHGLLEEVERGVPRLLEDAAGLHAETIQAHREAALWMMRGQAEFWYPTGEHLSEIHHRRGLLLTPGNQDLRRNLNFSEDIAGRVRAAMEERPRLAGPFEEMGRILLEQGRFEEAESLLLQSFRKEGSSPGARLNYSLLLLYTGRNEESLKILSGLKGPGAPPLVPYARSVALEGLGRKEEAQRHRSLALARSPLVGLLFDLREGTAKKLR